MNRYFFFTLFIFVLFIGTIHLQAQIPRTLSYQGVLTDSTGIPKPDSSYNLVFRMYDMESGGTALWSESETVTTKRGLFSTMLGDGSAFPSSMNFDEPYWLSIEVDAPPELTPRIPLTAVGYSMHSISADTAYVTVTSIGDTLWKKSGSNIYRLTGNVGIGTANPQSILHLYSDGYWPGIRVEGTDPNSGVSGLHMMSASRQFNLSVGGPNASPIENKFTIWDHTASEYRVVIDTNGYVGIGTTDALRKLHIYDDGNPQLRLEQSNGYIDFWGGENLHITTGPNHRFYIGGETGNIGIGVIPPAYKLDVNGDLNLAAGSVYRIGGVEQTGSSKWTSGSGDNIYRTNGFVGIGTNSPLARLHVASNTYAGINIQSLTNVGSYVNFADSDDLNVGSILYEHTNNQMSLITNDSTRVVINNSGSVGIGTTDASRKLHIYDEGNPQLRLEQSNGYIDFWGGENLHIITGTDHRFFISGITGNIGIGTNSPTATLEVKVGGTTLADAWSTRSSLRWGTNIKPLEGALEKLEKLQGVSFSWTADGKKDIGLIAEDVGAIVPEVVTYEDNGIDAQSIDYAKLVALLIEGMKDQQKQIDELKATLNSLSPKPIE